jgi:hypothetical protein
MKSLVTILLLVSTYFGCIAQQKGDELAILYRRVYAYKNPGELNTRYSKIPFSYRDKNKLVFISESENHPKYFKAKTISGDTIFVKKKFVSADQKLTHLQIEQDVENGLRKENYGDIVYQNSNDYPMWIPIAILIVFAVGLFFLRKYFSKIDYWFCRKNNPSAKPLSKPWFINYSLYAGLVIGSMQLISMKEYQWFMQDGMQVWGSYPSKWDWLMWAAVVALVVIIIGSAIQAFLRFQVKMAILYGIFSLLIIGLYYLLGLLLGAIALVILILFAVGSGGKSGPAPGTPLYNQSGMFIGHAK